MRRIKPRYFIAAVIEIAMPYAAAMRLTMAYKSANAAVISLYRSATSVTHADMPFDGSYAQKQRHFRRRQ